MSKSHALHYLLNPACRYFNGYRPCPVAREKGVACPSTNCSPIKEKLLVIEMGGLGSILRTTVTTKAYREKHPQAHITFLTHKEGREVLALAPSVDRVLDFSFENTLVLQAEYFDAIYNFEVEPAATSLTKLLSATKKYGFGVNDLGLPMIFDPASEELFRLQIEDDFRENNNKSIQQLLLEAVNIPWEEQLYEAVYSKVDEEFTAKFLRANGLDSKTIIGLNIGSRKFHALKRWKVDYFIELAKLIKEKTTAEPIILAGPHEKEHYDYCLKKLKRYGIIGAGWDNSFSRYLSLLDTCEVVVSATTFGLIAAIGLGKKVVVVCSPKPANEIYTYGKGIKIAYSGKYFPKYSTKIQLKSVNEELEAGIDNIPANFVFQGVTDALKGDFSNPIRYLVGK